MSVSSTLSRERTRRLLICFLTCLACGLAATASADAQGWTLRVQGQVTASDADALGLGEDFGTSVGPYVGVERQWNDRLGIELGIGRTELEQSSRTDAVFLTFDTTASLTMTPVTLALNVHLTPNASYDFYIAPRVGWVFFDDLEIRNDFDLNALPGFPLLLNSFTDLQPFVTLPAFQIPVDDQFVYGLRLGFDAPFGDSDWSFSSSVEILDVDLELEGFGAAQLALDPVSVGLGFGYRF